MQVHPFGRSVMNIGYTTCRGTVRSVVGDDVGKRRVCIVHDGGTMSVSLRHQRVKVSEGNDIIVVHYQADGFLPKLAGIHNCSSGAWYCVRQVDEYLENWLHVSRVQMWHYALVLALYLCAAGVLLVHLYAGVGVLVALSIGMWMWLRRIQATKVLVSAVACRSLEVQLMIEFRDLAATEEG